MLSKYLENELLALMRRRNPCGGEPTDLVTHMIDWDDFPVCHLVVRVKCGASENYGTQFALLKEGGQVKYGRVAIALQHLDLLNAAALAVTVEERVWHEAGN